jgi:hypothetical protein
MVRQLAQMVGGGVFAAILAVLLTHFLKAATLQLHRIGEHGQHNVPAAQLEVVGVLDAGKELDGDAGGRSGPSESLSHLG